MYKSSGYFNNPHKKQKHHHHGQRFSSQYPINALSQASSKQQNCPPNSSTNQINANATQAAGNSGNPLINGNNSNSFNSPQHAQ